MQDAKKDVAEVLNNKALTNELHKHAIEDDFPFEIISGIAEAESWRKEVYRPIYHLHKWWAQRLGSVFRAIIIGSATKSGSSLVDLFYQPMQFPGLVIFDPFMGSGTTIGEAHKLGCIAIGRDINPVSYRIVKTALGPMNRHEIENAFEKLSNIIAPRIRELYTALDSDGKPCEVLYYFWVKTLPCPKCNGIADLFPTFIFARNAYIRKNPSVHVVCPSCGDVFASTYGLEEITCGKCGTKFNPSSGWAKRTTVVCKHCNNEFSIIQRARELQAPPAHRMYAKLILRNDGGKEYLPITQKDIDDFITAKNQLRALNPPIPCIPIREGYNTDQILNYGYRYWHELFNERQLLALSLLAQSIHDLLDGTAHDALALLFSGTLEFNNMFASYKGEGTGAVRHMFSHHILKPERMPIEANIWGTPKSSGSFSTLFRSRLLKALDYRERPFELSIGYSGKNMKAQKVFSLCPPLGRDILASYPANGLKANDIYLSCGSSIKTDLPDQSVDLVITDPPFFNNVHYSELADFFYVWQELYFKDKCVSEITTTRHIEEVQDEDAGSFANKLQKVFQECHRVLKDDGLLVFSYHHSCEDGWSAIGSAIIGAGFSLIQCHPVKSEMSVAAPKNLAASPIDLDIILVCKKRINDNRRCIMKKDALKQAELQTLSKVERFRHSGRHLSKNDILIIMLSQILVELSPGRTEDEVVLDLGKLLRDARSSIETLMCPGQGSYVTDEKPQINILIPPRYS